MINLKKLFLISIFFINCFSSINYTLIPVTGSTNPAESIKSLPTVSLDEFSTSVQNGISSQLVGVFVNELFALPVIPQPKSNPAYVSTEKEITTQFSMAAQFGSIGLVAHNNLAGKHFFDLAEGDMITLVYGDGHQTLYQVTNIFQYKALSPTNPYSRFVDLESPNATLSVEAVFKKIYGVEKRLVFQTCIAKDKVDSWGRLFVVAEPVDNSTEEN